MPQKWRAALAPGERVLVFGATGASGRSAVASASALDASRVVAAGRNLPMLERLAESGATGAVRLEEGADLARAFAAAGEDGFDVVIDFLNGPPAEAALRVLRPHGLMLQIGSQLAPGIHFDAQVARRYSIHVRGFAYYHAPIAEQMAAHRALCDGALAARVAVDFETLPLADAGTAWGARAAGGGRRYVIELGH